MILQFQEINIFLINFSILLVTTSLIGSFMTILWIGIGKLLEKVGFLNIVFNLLKMVMFFYCFPLVYVILKVFERDLGRGYLFQPTETILEFTKLFLLIWGLGIIAISMYILHDTWTLRKKYKDMFICDMQTQELFNRVLSELNLESRGKHSRLVIRQSYRTKIPCITGILYPVIILPVTAYSQEDLRYILIHELMHYKQKDILLKRISIIICAFHFYNPFAWLLLVQIQKWSEFACDFKVCHHTKKVSEYFEVLIRAATAEGIKVRLMSHLVEDQHELVERAKKMKSVFGKKKRSKWSVAIVLGTAFILSSMTVSAVTLESAEKYIQLVEDTDVSTEEEVIQYEEFTEQGEDENVIAIAGEVNVLTRSANSFEWQVKNLNKVYSPIFQCQEGDFVSVVVNITPSNVNVKVGIEDMSGNKRYVNSNGNIRYVFDIYYDSNYRFFVENLSGTTVTVTGNYITP